ncbi:MAG: hypothetical protein WBE28_11600 [bacterium]
MTKQSQSISARNVRRSCGITRIIGNHHGILFALSLAALCLLVSCAHICDGWYDDGQSYLCPECANHFYFQLGDICERCGGGTNVNPLKYCYDCAKELNCCQCWCPNCEGYRWVILKKPE